MHSTVNCLTDRLGEALTTSPHLFGRTLDYEADSGIVVLTGKVNSFYQKQMAYSIHTFSNSVAFSLNKL